MNISVKIVHVGDYSVGKSRLTDTFVQIRQTSIVITVDSEEYL